MTITATFLGKYSGCIDYNVDQEYELHLWKESKYFYVNKIGHKDNFGTVMYSNIFEFLEDWNNIKQN